MSSAQEAFSYYPSERAEKQFKAAPKDTQGLPAGFPLVINEPSGLVWTPDLEIVKPDNYTYLFTKEDLDSISIAVTTFQGL